MIFVFDGQGVIPRIDEKTMNNILFMEIISHGLAMLDLDKSDLFSLPKAELLKTENVQVAILLYDIAYYYSVIHNQGLKPEYVTGQSLGLFPALFAAGVLYFEDVVDLVVDRANFMGECANNNPGKMGVVFQANLDLVESVCQQESSVDSLATLANRNSASQITFSGHTDAVEKIVNVLNHRGYKSHVLKRVTGAWHSALMKEAEERFTECINAAAFKDAVFPVIINGKVYQKGKTIQKIMRTQITRRDDFYATIQYMMAENIEVAMEIGPSEILGRFIKETIPDIRLVDKL